METVQHTGAFLRRRKMMMFLPLLILPFITMAFWALGGGNTSSAKTDALSQKKGLNPQLPSANLKADNGVDKFSYYELAAADSAQLQQRARSAQYFTLPPSADTHEIVIHQQLAAINTALENAAAMHSNTLPAEKINNAPDVNTARMEKMMQQLKPAVQQNSDTELSQINSMLEKVMDIQHPERLNDKYKMVDAPGRQADLTVRANDTGNTGFFSIDGRDTGKQVMPGIEASVYETQTLVNGSTVKLRLQDDIVVGGVKVPANVFIYGIAALAGERLTVTITCIRYGSQLLPVSLDACDLDGMAGLYIPGAITRDVAKQSADNALQSVALNSLDPSIGARAAGAGIETAKNLISKKVRTVRVTVKAGYRVLLRDTNSTP